MKDQTMIAKKDIHMQQMILRQGKKVKPIRKIVFALIVETPVVRATNLGAYISQKPKLRCRMIS